MNFRRIVPSVVSILLFAAAASAQLPYRRKAVDPSMPPVVSGDTQLLWNAYERAVYDSSVYQRWNLRRLRPLTPDADGMVLVSTLTSTNGEAGKPITAGSGGIWVTSVPEVQTICRGFRGDVDMQLRMLLGLPPDADTPRFIVMRAKATDLFRPAVSPDISTLYPCAVAAGGEPPAECGNVFPADTTPAHYQWMATSAFSLHAVPNGYPWTHLGYTYNWKPGADRYGASEYLIREGATALITQVVSPTEYCAPVP